MSSDLSDLEKDLREDEGPRKEVVHEEGGVVGHLLAAAEVEVAGPPGEVLLEIPGDPAGEGVGPLGGGILPPGEAGDVEGGDGPEERLVVEVGGGPHTVEQGESGNTGAGHGEVGGDADAGGDEDDGPRGGPEGEVPVGAREGEGRPHRRRTSPSQAIMGTICS